MNDDDWDGEKEGLGREDGWGEERKENWEGERWKGKERGEEERNGRREEYKII